VEVERYIDLLRAYLNENEGEIIDILKWIYNEYFAPHTNQYSLNSGPYQYFLFNLIYKIINKKTMIYKKYI